MADNHQTRFRAAQWRMLLASMFCYFFYYTGRQTFGFAIPGIEAELGLSKTQLGGAGLVLLWSYAIGQSINGNLGDKFGGRRMMSLGAILSCGLNWVVSFSTGLVSLLVPWGINGYAQAMAWAPGSRLLANWWGPQERGKAFGLFVFAAGMSSVLSFTTSLVVLEVLELDWRWIFRGPVLLLLVGGVIYYLIVRDRPQDLGFVPIADEGTQADDADQVQSGSVAADDFDQTSLTRYKHALTNWRFLIAGVAIGFQGIARYGLIFWVPVHFLSDTWKKDPSGKWISLALAIGMAMGALTSGWLSDRAFSARRSPIITICLSLTAVGAAGLYFLPAEQKLLGIVLLFLCGFFVFGSQSAFWALCPDLLGRRCAGTGAGVMNTFQYGFAGVGEVFIGWMIENHKIEGPDGLLIDNTAIVFPIVAVVALLGALISPLIRR